MTDSRSDPSSKPWDRLLSKWTALLALLLLICGIPLSFWMPYQRQRWALQAIEAAGAKVSVEFGPGGPDWLRNLIGDEAMQVFDEPKRIFILGAMPRFGDEGLRRLAGLANVNTLVLTGAQVSDDGLAYLVGLTELRYLGLSHTQISDEGLKHLAGLTDLENLYLADTQVSDEGVARLRRALPGCMIYAGADAK
jgi:hypothetical protein